jgi:hypothetical protein
MIRSGATTHVKRQHIGILRQIEIDGMKSTLAICSTSSQRVVRDRAGTFEDRKLVLMVQRNATRSSLDDLRDQVRKHGDEFRYELEGAERDSWGQAIFLTAGWPAPIESAGEPERRQ